MTNLHSWDTLTMKAEEVYVKGNWNVQTYLLEIYFFKLSKIICGFFRKHHIIPLIMAGSLETAYLVPTPPSHSYLGICFHNQLKSAPAFQNIAHLLLAQSFLVQNSLDSWLETKGGEKTLLLTFCSLVSRFWEKQDAGLNGLLV